MGGGRPYIWGEWGNGRPYIWGEGEGEIDHIYREVGVGGRYTIYILGATIDQIYHGGGGNDRPYISKGGGGGAITEQNIDNRAEG